MEKKHRESCHHRKEGMHLGGFGDAPRCRCFCTCPVSPQPTEESWKELFDVQFKDVWYGKESTFVPIPNGVRMSMHTFIRFLLTSQRDEIIALAEEMKKNCYRYDTYADGHDNGYDEALDNLIEKLQSKKQ